MDKVKDFLERYVQWVALGIAALFLVWALYSYLPGVNTPVTVALKNGTVLPPGEADQQILTEVAAPLESEINSTAALPKIDVPAYGTVVRDRLNAAPAAPAFPNVAFVNRPVELPDIKWDAPIGEQNYDTTHVRALPTLPAAILNPDPTTGFAQVNPSAAGSGATPVAAGADPTAANTATPTTGQTRDVTWVRVPFTISSARLVQAFREVNLPVNWDKTTILRVELVRQKQLPDGEWSPEQTVAALPFLPLQPLPAQNAGLQPQQQYLTWAQQNQPIIVQPPFFQVMAGDDPTLEPPAAPVEADPAAFDPAQYPAGVNISHLTGPQKLEVAAYRKRIEDERRASAAQAQPRAPRGNRGGAEGGGERVRNRPPPQPRPEPVAEPVVTDTRAVYQPPTPGPAIQLAPLPTAPFNPAEATGDIQGVAYDITGTTEATYRYRIRYLASNPIFGSQNVAEPQTLAQTFALVGEDANIWSTPVTIAPLTHIYVAQALNPAPNAIVKFNVYRWQAGRWHASTATAASGDSIGKVDNGIDYKTPWTVVEVRSDSSSPARHVLLMNADGSLRRQEFDRDNNSPEQARLKAQVEAANAAVPGADPAAAPGATGGRVGGGMGGATGPNP